LTMRFPTPLAVLAVLILAGAAPLAAQSPDSLRREAESAYRRHDYPASTALYLRLTSMTTPSAHDLYNAACSAALAGRAPDALGLLLRALDAGFDGYDLLLERDTDLASLRVLPGWAEVAAAARGREAARNRMVASLPEPGRVFGALPSAGYLATLLALDEMDAAHADAPEGWRGLLRELRAWMRAMVGDPVGALALEPGDARPRPPLSPSFDALTPVPAVEAILAAARGRRVVMVNEAHHVPQGRVLTLELLRGLHDQGFRYFAVEALGSRSGEALARDRYPLLATGTYTRDPVFGELLRAALRMGYTLVPYDSYPVGCRPTPDDPNRCNTLRDSMAAEKIHAAVFARDPGAKVLVHAGYSHVVKVPRPGGTQWLGSWLERRGLAPLAVDQTEMRERAATELEPAEYRRAEALGWLTRPVVLREPGGGWYRSAADGFGSVDLQVFTPRTRTLHGRPDWLFTRAGRKAAPLSRATRAQIPRDGQPHLVQAFVWGEADAAVPHDQVVVRGVEAPTLALLPGRYRVVVVGRGGEVARGEMTVR
ncbi:MAG TPA: hypothetical protein VE913_02095, partial [Longimicrobium sp.]|nr:hypothetical protein [Longimicrobium sp.]